MFLKQFNHTHHFVTFLCVCLTCGIFVQLWCELNFFSEKIIILQSFLTDVRRGKTNFDTLKKYTKLVGSWVILFKTFGRSILNCFILVFKTLTCILNKGGPNFLRNNRYYVLWFIETQLFYNFCREPLTIWMKSNLINFVGSYHHQMQHQKKTSFISFSIIFEKVKDRLYIH